MTIHWQRGDTFTLPHGYTYRVDDTLGGRLKLFNVTQGYALDGFMDPLPSWEKARVPVNPCKEIQIPTKNESTSNITYTVEYLNTISEWNPYRHNVDTYDKAMEYSREVARERKTDHIRIKKVEVIETVLQGYKIVLQPV